MSPKPSDTASLMLSLVDGTGQPFNGEILLRVRNARDVDSSQFEQGPDIDIQAPFHDGPGDDYMVMVTADGHRDTGYPFHADNKVHAQLTLLMLPKHNQFEFPGWDDLKTSHLTAAAFLQTGSDEPTARQRYTDTMAAKPAALACLLNLTQAMSEIDLGGTSPLPFFREIIWDDSMKQDRFFGYADPAIIPLVRAAAGRGEFAEEPDPGKFHPGATCSWKQIQFDVANVQLTFHENDADTKVIGGLKCVKIEPDIDLYKDLLLHGLGEVIPNKVKNGLTDPVTVYAMRWTIAEDGGGPDFDPGYEIV